jgi:hypothetical protein
VGSGKSVVDSKPRGYGNILKKWNFSLFADWWQFANFDIIAWEVKGRMTIQKRSIVMGALLAFASICYGAAKYYSPSLVLYVVKQSLIQKAPSGRDSILLQERLQALVSAAPNQKTLMERLLRISRYLEKVQHLTPEELDELLSIENADKTAVL